MAPNEISYWRDVRRQTAGQSARACNQTFCGNEALAQNRSFHPRSQIESAFASAVCTLVSTRKRGCFVLQIGAAWSRFRLPLPRAHAAHQEPSREDD